MNWAELIVTDSAAENAGTLGNFMHNAEAIDVRYMTINDRGALDSWQDYFISAPGELPEWDTPRGEVDWTGFPEAYELAKRR